MLDKFLFRVVPALLLAAVGLLYYPHTSRVIRNYIADWYFARFRVDDAQSSVDLQPSRTRSISWASIQSSQASCSSLSSTSV